MKTHTNINCNLLPIFDKSLPEDCPVSFQTHSQCFDHKIQQKTSKKQLFRQIFLFISKIIEDENFYNNITAFLTRNEIKQKKSENSMVDQSQQKRIPFKNVSFKKMQITSNNCFQSTKNVKMSEADITQQRRVSKKISIVIFGNDQDQEMFSGSDSIISQEEMRTLRQIKLPNLKLTEELIRDIYQAPSPFLMNLSLCLLLKYCIKRNARPDWNDVAWIVAIATIEAFKIYYDEQLQGMFDCFQNVLRISKQDLVDLQRCFLQKIDYNVIIQNYDYQFVLSKFVQMQRMNQKENQKK